MWVGNNVESGFQPAVFIPELPLLVSVEQTRADSLAAHTPAHGVYFLEEIHEDSSSNMSTVLSLLLGNTL